MMDDHGSTFCQEQLGDGEVYLVAATLLTETMYGQTNCFVLPEGTVHQTGKVCFILFQQIFEATKCQCAKFPFCSVKS